MRVYTITLYYNVQPEVKHSTSNRTWIEETIQKHLDDRASRGFALYWS